ncbi:hypothetical protein C0992_009839 [Termitomyces sp. T32_za158]|nr:hypothetical protein C0992_009839 [Termitomyces sp. T32_za158]
MEQPPTIRLVSATPSASGPSTLAPAVSPGPRRRLVPRKSRLKLATESVPPIDVYTDPKRIDDDDIAEVVVVRKRRRAALDTVQWDAENEPKDDSNKWWSIARGRADSKEKRAARQRSMTPEPFKAPDTLRTRFNSLGANFLFSNTAPDPGSQSQPQSQPQPQPQTQSQSQTQSRTRGRSRTLVGLFAGPTQVDENSTPKPSQAAPQHQHQGSIALRAIRSMRSLARIGSWAQMRGGGGAGVDENGQLVEREKKKTSAKEGDDTKKAKKKKKKKKGEGGKSKIEGEAQAEGEVEGGKRRKLKKEKGEETRKVKKKKEVAHDVTPTPTLRRVRVRGSTSSFEAGSATPETKGLGTKKRSILGLGLPSTIGLSMRLRSGSNASVRDGATKPPSPTQTPILIIGRDPAVSAGTSSGTAHIENLRPVSVVSDVSSGRVNRLSSGSGSSVRWDEGCLESGRAARRREREEREREREKEGEGVQKARRVLVSEVFAEARQQVPLVVVDRHGDGGVAPESENENEGEGGEDEKPLQTPVRRARHRWHSEQLDGRSRPRPLYEGEDGVLSILDAATNDLAQLINHLDLQATPATPDVTSLLPSPSPSPPTTTTATAATTTSKSEVKTETETATAAETKTETGRARVAAANANANGSPTKGRYRSASVRAEPSVGSLRPYAQSRRNTLRSGSGSLRNAGPSAGATSVPAPAPAPAPAVTGKTPCVEQTQPIGRRIAPWPVLFAKERERERERDCVSPIDEADNDDDDNDLEKTPVQRGFRSGRAAAATATATMTPGPEPEPEPVFIPLRPAKSRGTIALLRAQFEAAAAAAAGEVKGRESVVGARTATGAGTVRAPSLRTFGSRSSSSRRESKAVSEVESEAEASMGSVGWPTPKRSPVFRRAPSPNPVLNPAPVVLPMDVDEEEEEEESAEPSLLGGRGEKRRVLRMSGLGVEVQEDTMSLCREEGEALGDVDDDLMDSGPVVSALNIPTFRTEFFDEDNRSVFTGAAVDVDAMLSDEDIDNTKKSFDFTAEIRKLNESGASDRESFVEQLENAFRTPAKVDLRYAFPGPLSGRSSEGERPPVPKFPVHLAQDGVAESSQGRGGLKSAFGFSQDDDEMHDVDMSDSDADASPKPVACFRPRPSDGQLNKAFKFGGLPKDAPPVSALPQQRQQQQQQDVPKTLADIIPPPCHVRSLSNSSSMLLEDDSVLKSIFGKASSDVRPRLNSDSSVQRRAWENAQTQYRHSRHSSVVSFAGFESFDEVRRGFEFSGDQSFYPPPSRRVGNPRQRDSVLSIASVSSYGRAHDFGLADPFDYGLPSLRESPSSENLSISMSVTVDDTFSFIHRQPRKRVASDASSFYFRSAASRRQSRRESGMSIASLAPPPVSLFNRGFGSHHRRNDSSSSAQSIALSYVTHGASGGRAIWARHRQESSVDSVNSDFSAMRLGRPGIGDKMFDAMLDSGVGDHCVSLGAISASSPSENVAQENPAANRSSFEFDSIIDHEPQSSTVDSLFGEKPTLDSVFGRNDDSQASKGALLQVPRYRPLSVISLNSTNTPVREDDTMISMLGGGHVRRRSIDASPCQRIEKRKHSDSNLSSESRESPNKARILEKPSVVSTSSLSFASEIQPLPCESRDSPNTARINGTLSISSDSTFSFGSEIQPLVSHGSSESCDLTHEASVMEKQSIVSTSSSSFDSEPVVKSNLGLLEQQSADETVLIGEGEDLQSSCE